MITPDFIISGVPASIAVVIFAVGCVKCCHMLYEAISVAWNEFKQWRRKA